MVGDILEKDPSCVPPTKVSLGAHNEIIVKDINERKDEAQIQKKRN